MLDLLLTVFSYAWMIILVVVACGIWYSCFWYKESKESRIMAVIITIIFLVFCSSLGFFIRLNDTKESKAAELSESRQKVADQIADICIEEWDTYGRLPSIAVGQAFIESGLGVGSNIFGVKGDAGKGPVAATYGYLKCLNNEYFNGEGAFIFDREEQLRIIMEGGRYCAGQYPDGRYYNDVLNSISKYEWGSYDEILAVRLNERAERERRKKARDLRRSRQRGTFNIRQDEQVEPGTCIADPEYIKKGSVVIFGYNILECLETQEGLGNTILVQDSSMGLPLIFDDGLEMFDNCEVHLTEVIENAKG